MPPSNPLGVADRSIASAIGIGSSTSVDAATEDTFEAELRLLLRHRIRRDEGRSGPAWVTVDSELLLRTVAAEDGRVSLRSRRMLSEMRRARRRTFAPDFSNSVLDRRGMSAIVWVVILEFAWPPGFSSWELAS